jgi:hypothetical protein
MTARKVAIVTRADPANQRFGSRGYESVASSLSTLIALAKADYEVVLHNDEEAAIQWLRGPEGKGHGVLVFVSRYFEEKANELARRHWPHVKIVVYSVGLPESGQPLHVYRGMVTPETVASIF